MAKYQPYLPVERSRRQCPDRAITAAPIWCSVGLRDGNQALINPMSVDHKLHLYRSLVEMGIREIVVGFPTASRDDHAFLRRLTEDDMISMDVWPQTLVQARVDLVALGF